MALRGSLSDLGIIDLMQFPNSGRKTGLLSVTGEKGEARLYYTKGKLVHAQLGDLKSMDALVELSNWSQGEFEFHIGVEPNQTTIEMDLHRLVMMVLKTRDERAHLQKLGNPSNPPRYGTGLGPATRIELEKFIQSQSFALHACMLDENGGLVAEASSGKQVDEEIGRLREVLQVLMRDYPRKGLKRIFVDDDLGFVVGARLTRGIRLLVVVAHNTTLGTVALSVGRLMETLEKKAAS